MPAKPLWIARVPNIIQEIEALPRPFVDRATIEFLLGVGRRRAQQILAPCVTDRVGTNGLADRARVIARLQELAAAPESTYEIRRRQRVAGALAKLHKDRVELPQLLVEAPIRVVSQALDSLPPGVQLAPGRITIEFEQPQQALEKLLALAMAIGNDFEVFAETTKKG